MERVKEGVWLLGSLKIYRNREDLRESRVPSRLVLDRSRTTNAEGVRTFVSRAELPVAGPCETQQTNRRTVTEQKKYRNEEKAREKAREERLHSVYTHNVRVLRGVGVPPGGAAPRRATARRCDYK